MRLLLICSVVVVGVLAVRAQHAKHGELRVRSLEIQGGSELRLMIRGDEAPWLSILRGEEVVAAMRHGAQRTAVDLQCGPKTVSIYASEGPTGEAASGAPLAGVELRWGMCEVGAGIASTGNLFVKTVQDAGLPSERLCGLSLGSDIKFVCANSPKVSIVGVVEDDGVEVAMQAGEASRVLIHCDDERSDWIGDRRADALYTILRASRDEMLAACFWKTPPEDGVGVGWSGRAAHPVIEVRLRDLLWTTPRDPGERK